MECFHLHVEIFRSSFVVIFAQYDVAMQLQLIMQLSYIFSQCNGGGHLKKENMTSCKHKQRYTFKKTLFFNFKQPSKQAQG